MSGLKVSIKFQPQDCWVGIHWEPITMRWFGDLMGYTVCVCLIPMLPIKFTYYFKPAAQQEQEE